ncbi:MAG: hypothetical protein IAE79_02120 [Anaerolinea sp.]|nr:hypothetical protein [Anaerolinea sp.]
MMQNKKQQTSVPGVWATIAAGFDLAAKHFWLILIPVFLDTFLWLGPRLSLRLLIEQAAALWQQEVALAAMGEQLLLLAPHTNLFTSLSVPLLGVPALMAGAAPLQTPLHTAVLELDSAVLMLGLFVLFSLVGLLLTAVYLTLIARTTQLDKPAPDMFTGRILRRIGYVWLRLLALGLIFLVGMMLLYMPLALVSVVVSLLSPTLGLLTLLLGPLLAVWLVLACYFVPQGLALHGRSPLQALMTSLQLLRIHGQTAMGLILAVVLLGGLLDQFLTLMEDGGWITFISILAHAFISTSFVAATFIFYRDRVTAVVSQ